MKEILFVELVVNKILGVIKVPCKKIVIVEDLVFFIHRTFRISDNDGSIILYNSEWALSESQSGKRVSTYPTIKTAEEAARSKETIGKVRGYFERNPNEKKVNVDFLLKLKLKEIYDEV
jgi:hypothetical protein